MNKNNVVNVLMLVGGLLIGYGLNGALLQIRHSSFCFNNEGNGVLLAEHVNLTKLTRLSDGAINALDNDVSVIRKEEQANLVACPKN